MDYFDTVIPVLLSFSISVILCPIVIPFLKWLKFGQYVRDDGPKSHLKKAGTPTMGGLIILISVVVTSSLYLRDYPEILPVIFATVGFGLIGFLDDYIKIVMRRSLGLRAWQKLVLQLLVLQLLLLSLMIRMQPAFSMFFWKKAWEWRICGLI